MKEMIPAAPSIAALLDSATPNFEIDSNSLIAAAKAVGSQVYIIPASTLAEVDSALETIAKRQFRPSRGRPKSIF